MRYFAYGSNMSILRLRERVPGARRIESCVLTAHDLRFHKSGSDGSAKCDAYHTGARGDYVMGALFEVCPSEKPRLDSAEGLGHGYLEKTVTVSTLAGAQMEAFTYYAISIDELLKPYNWYVNHVLVGARESLLPDAYVTKIEAVEGMADPNQSRNARQWAIHCQ